MREMSPTCLGEAIYFFEHAVSVSGYLLGVNPFDQPGVEAYKKEMFTRLGKTVNRDRRVGKPGFASWVIPTRCGKNM